LKTGRHMGPKRSLGNRPVHEQQIPPRHGPGPGALGNRPWPVPSFGGQRAQGHLRGYIMQPDR
jgi:hypothetical protein